MHVDGEAGTGVGRGCAVEGGRHVWSGHAIPGEIGAAGGHSWPAGGSCGGYNSLALKSIKLILAPLERGGGDLSIGTLPLKLYYNYYSLL